MKDKTLFVVIMLALAIVLLTILTSCHTTHYEHFVGNSDSVAYWRDGRVELKWFK